MIIYFANKPNSSLCLSLIIKQVKLKHINVLVKKNLEYETQFQYYIYACIKIYLYKLKIKLFFF